MEKLRCIPPPVCAYLLSGVSTWTTLGYSAPTNTADTSFQFVALRLAWKKDNQKLCEPRANEPPHDKTNKMIVCPAKTPISLGMRPVWSESSLCVPWVAKDPSFLRWANIWVFSVPQHSYNWAAAWQNKPNDLCAQPRLRSAWASAQSDQSLRCLHIEALGPWLPIGHKQRRWSDWLNY